MRELIEVFVLKKKKEIKINGKLIFYISIISMFLFSATFMIMPFASDYSVSNENNSLLIIVGAVFWGSLVVAVLASLYVTSCRCRYNKVHPSEKKHIKIGLISFFSNREALVFDLMFIVSTIGFVFCLFFDESIVSYIFLSIFVFSFFMHCVLNGKNFNYIKTAHIIEPDFYEKHVENDNKSENRSAVRKTNDHIIPVKEKKVGSVKKGKYDYYDNTKKEKL